MNKKIFSFFLLPPLLLTSCSFRGNVEAIKNGDLNLTSDENMFQNIDFNNIDKMMKNGDSFILYLTDNECYSCQQFNPIITEYVKNTQQLIYKLDIREQQDDFIELGKNYKDFFFPLYVITPQVYIYSKSKAVQFVKNTRYDTLSMFSNAMKEYLYETNVYSFKDVASLKSFIIGNEEMIYLIYDSSDESQQSEYSLVKEKLFNAKKKIALIDYDKINDKIDSFNELLKKPNNKEIYAGTFFHGQIKSTISGTLNEYLTDIL